MVDNISKLDYYVDTVHASPIQKYTSSMEKAKLFRIALTIAEMTLQEWAAAQEPPVAPVTVYELLRGRLTSARLTESMDAFIAQHLATLRHVMREVA